jgi:AcrR family transcriptional regulator
MTEKRKTGRPKKIPGQKNTSQVIFEKAIDLFSQRGYGAVSIRDIAKAAGIKESSIYKHYTSKDQILQKIVQYPLAKIYTIATRDETTEELIAKMGATGFLNECSAVFTGWLSDPNTVKILRIFYIELYHNNEIKKAYTDLISAGENFWTLVFRLMIKQGHIKQIDPELLSTEFLAFIWNAFANYFLVQYDLTSASFMDLYSESMTRHMEYFLKTAAGEKNEY